jgi:hypothetical protein
MEMEMGHRLTSPLAGIRYQAKAAVDYSCFTGKLRRDGEEPAEHRRMRVGQVRGRDDVLARHEQQVCRSLWVEVGDRDDQVVVVQELRRDLARDDAAEDAVDVGHGFILGEGLSHPQ